MRTLVWYRGKDLRVADHEPLEQAAKDGDVVPVFVLDDYFFAPEAAQRMPFRIQFLLESIASLAANLEHLGSRLIIATGRSVDRIPEFAATWKVDRVVAQSWVAPVGRARDRLVSRRLKVPLRLFDTETLCPPGSLRTGAGEPFSVFSAFARAFARDVKVPAPLPAPRSLPSLPKYVKPDKQRLPTLESLGLTHNDRVQPGGESAARARLKLWLGHDAKDYDELRNLMGMDGTSRLGADLKFGTLSPRTVWHAIDRVLRELSPDALRVYQNELLWREFAHSTLFDRPRLLKQPFRAEWRDFPWRDDEAGWQAWVAGHTGYPVVDASARQLLHTGFVHNRARMISASFLAKHLLIDFRKGEQHYYDLLTDGDWANNDMGWQWSAGCGCDAQPWFRIFNPVAQGEKFDPDGDYVRTWVPELALMPGKYIHAPWLAPTEVLAAAGVRLGANYPRPIVDHAQARQRFLDTAKQHLK
ncbi:MAG TPA: deoxyribodipyrimidine photo-lyase [Steroidobacteraceae bacterium]|nr:deoxyribodipyrimidine photo-lyase [Steroidobacteraceae bacterium]